MKKIVTLFFLLSLFGLLNGCVSVSQKNDMPDVLYVIPHLYQKTFAHQFKQDLSLLFYYGQFNFLLTNNQIFLHRQFVKINKDEKVDYNKPPQLNLMPNNLKEINLADLQTFLNTNLLDTIIANRTVNVSIVSTNDTIRNPAFSILSNYFQSKSHFTYIIRNWTEEEQYALKALLFKTNYNPDTIHWKIGFGKLLNLKNDIKIK